jgi:hypothetical protein
MPAKFTVFLFGRELNRLAKDMRTASTGAHVFG